MARTGRSPRAGPRRCSRRLPGARTTPFPPPQVPRGRRVLVPLGPGQLVPIEVHDVRVLRPGERIVLAGQDGAAPGQVILAFDGEREIALTPGSVAAVRRPPG